MIKLKTLIKEFVQNPIVDLGRYLKSSEQERILEMAYYYSIEIFDWLDINGHNQLPGSPSEKDDETGEQMLDYLKHHHPDILKEFGKEHVNGDEDMTRPGYPSWKYMDFRSYIKNQWLIHFSDSASDIWSSQKFSKGVWDYTELGLTTYYKDSYKKNEGYNFAYDVSDFAKYGRSSYRSGDWKYGAESVLFRASGVKVWHHGDGEPQVIFWGPTARDIVYLQKLGEGDWGVTNNNNRVIYRNQTLPELVRWVMLHFDQYKRVLLP